MKTIKRGDVTMIGLAWKAIDILSYGILNQNKDQIREAYAIVEAKDFDWEVVPDFVFNRWDEQTDKANEILMS